MISASRYQLDLCRLFPEITTRKSRDAAVSSFTYKLFSLTYHHAGVYDTYPAISDKMSIVCRSGNRFTAVFNRSDAASDGLLISMEGEDISELIHSSGTYANKVF